MTHDIAFIIADLGCGGAQRVVATLASTWARRGRRVCIITLASPDDDFFKLDPGVTRLSLGGLGDTDSVMSAIGSNLLRLRQLRRAIREAEAGTVIAFLASMNILTIIATLGLGLTVAISERNDPTRQSHGRVWDLLRRLLYRHADLVTANSRGALAALGGFVPDAKLVYAPNPIQPYSATVAATARIDTLKFLIVARLNHQKAHDVLLDAFALIADKAPSWRLQVVGDGDLETALKRQAETLGISDRVDWLRIAHDPYKCYVEADCFVLPSRFEGTPNALLEAMGCGLPAIVSNASPGPLEHVKDNVNGLVVPVDNANALAAAMERLAHDLELRQRLGQAARKHIENHDPKKIIETWERFLDLTPVKNVEPA
ncbi:MAG TPA: glycosyltransferase family 4 protein [Sneathiellales bacterium]|nr:glycosyltransferase family 4 protein [Sneathiellales bacterium]